MSAKIQLINAIRSRNNMKQECEILLILPVSFTFLVCGPILLECFGPISPLMKVSQLLQAMDVGEVNRKDKSCEPALNVACREFNLGALNLLLSKPGIDVNVKDDLENTPLYVACFYNNSQAASKLLSTPGVDVNAQESYGWTPLHFACYFNHLQIVSALLASPGVHVNIRCNSGYSPVMYAAAHCQKEALRLMLQDPRVDLEAEDEGGRGLDVLVGSQYTRKDQKGKCLEMIYSEKMERENRRVERRNLKAITMVEKYKKEEAVMGEKHK